MAYRVILLCAGISERLRPITYSTNKCLLKIGNKTVIEHLLDSFVGQDIEMIYIIVGYYGYRFRKLLGKKYRGLKIRFFTNRLYAITGGAQSLYIASHILRRNKCIISDGDMLIDPKLMDLLISSNYENCMLLDEDLSRIEFDEEILGYGSGGILKHIQCRPPYPPNPLGEFPAIFKLSKKASNAYQILLEQHLLDSGDAKREFIVPLNNLLKIQDIQYISTEGRAWLDLDFPHDLKKAQTFRFSERGGD